MVYVRAILLCVKVSKNILIKQLRLQPCFAHIYAPCDQNIDRELSLLKL